MTGWTTVQRSGKINYDLEKSPLQIRTDSVSYENVRMNFYNFYGNSAGGVALSFYTPPQYRLNSCTTSFTNFPTALSTEAVNIWTIILNRISGAVWLIIYCNNKEVLNVALSETTCSDSDWSKVWSKDVEKIEFASLDTASNYFRPGKYLYCNCLKCALVHHYISVSHYYYVSQ